MEQVSTQVSTEAIQSLSDQVETARKNLSRSAKALQRIQQNCDKQIADVRTLSEKYSQIWFNFFTQTLHNDKLTWCTNCEKLQKLGETRAFMVTVENVNDLFPSSSVYELCAKCLKVFDTNNWYGPYNTLFKKQSRREVRSLIIDEHGVYFCQDNQPVPNVYQRDNERLYKIPDKTRAAFNKRYGIKLIPK